jgi:superfamily II DNA or RNA helicase
MLRDYQTKLIDDARESMRKHRHICVQSPTGSGKTWTFTEIVKRLTANNMRSWITVPRNELLDQASATLKAAGIPHGRIAAGVNESKLFQVHVVSKDTLIRRYGKIIRQPDYIIPDECHIALDQQIAISEQFPKARMIGFSATPKPGMDRLYQDLVTGPQLMELVEHGHLSVPRYFSPPLEGLNEVSRTAGEYNDDELQKLLTERMVYGRAIEMYKQHADGQPCLVFCRSVKSAHDTAARFRSFGYRAECIDGGMSNRRRRALLEGFRNGQINMLTSAMLLTYGVDLPTVSCIIMLRPTGSTALYFQMLGRGLRVAEGKDSCVILDHVNNIGTHCPGGHPLDYRTWTISSDGTDRQKPKDPDELTQRLCPEIEFLYCNKKSCVGCEHNKTNRKERRENVVECELQEIKAPTSGSRKEKQEWEKKIETKVNRLVIESRSAIRPGPIGELLKIAKAMGRDWRWVYDEINTHRHMVNIALLTEIGRQSQYSPKWVWVAKKKLIEEMGK